MTQPDATSADTERIPRLATPAEQRAVYRSRTKLPAGLTEDELFAAYGVEAVRS